MVDKANDPYDLNRFLIAQQDDYQQALTELKAGEKQSHWMWYIFPQIDGLAFSSTAKYFSIKSIEEAQAYLAHPILGARLLECAETVVGIEGQSITEILGSPDDLKLRSCVTLFASLSPSGSVFERILKKYYDGLDDEKTLLILEKVKKTVS
jgi:uncharacterized protein (DUF1810 family)